MFAISIPNPHTNKLWTSDVKSALRYSSFITRCCNPTDIYMRRNYYLAFCLSSPDLSSLGQFWYFLALNLPPLLSVLIPVVPRYRFLLLSATFRSSLFTSPYLHTSPVLPQATSCHVSNPLPLIPLIHVLFQATGLSPSPLLLWSSSPLP